MRLVALLFIAIVTVIPARAEEIRLDALPLDAMRAVIPPSWYIAVVSKATTVNGWDRLDGSAGVSIIVIRAPYDTTLHRSKSGQFTPYVPRITIDIVPDDYVGRNTDSRAVFRAGLLVAPNDEWFATRGVLVLSSFRAVGPWFAFYNDVSFEDWETPVDDLVGALATAVSTQDDR